MQVLSFVSLVSLVSVVSVVSPLASKWEMFLGRLLNLMKSPSNSVGARAGRGGRAGLDGRPRPFACARLFGNGSTPPPPGDHQGPPPYPQPPPPLLINHASIPLPGVR